MKSRLEQLEIENAELKTIIKKLTARIEELERRLKLNNQTSHKPSSADPFRKPESTREKTNKPSGGQNGHKGQTLAMKEVPDKVNTIQVQVCEKCHTDLSQIKSQRNRRAQVFDIPPPEVFVTEFQTEEKVCTCGHTTVGKLPDGIHYGAQYGSRIRIIASYLNAQQFIPEDRVSQVMADLLGVNLCAASVGNYVVDLAKKLASCNEMNRQAVAATRVKHGDETFFRILGKTAWLHVQSTLKHTYYKATATRGDIIKANYGVLVSDHFKSYKTLDGIQHAFCNAHHIRELKAVHQYDKESWAGSLKKLLQFACYKAKCADLDRYRKKINDQFDTLIEQGLKYHERLPSFESKSGRKRRKSYNLLVRLRDNKESVLRFLYEFDVPFTNNLAERDLRMMKVKQKISGGFRSMEGAQNFCCIRGVISTLQKQDQPVFAFLTSLYPSLT